MSEGTSQMTSSNLQGRGSTQRANGPHRGKQELPNGHYSIDEDGAAFADLKTIDEDGERPRRGVSWNGTHFLVDPKEPDATEG